MSDQSSKKCHYANNQHKYIFSFPVQSSHISLSLFNSNRDKETIKLNFDFSSLIQYTVCGFLSNSSVLNDINQGFTESNITCII